LSKEELQQAHIRGQEIYEMKNSIGWKTLDELVQEAINKLRENMKKSDDQSVVFACSKKIDGIMLVKELADEIISDGQEAGLKLEGISA
tara:strand:- start:345 stop:611 length:267 start_codon:yes stop_codon:yes gene_type:complete